MTSERADLVKLVALVKNTCSVAAWREQGVSQIQKRRCVQLTDFSGGSQFTSRKSIGAGSIGKGATLERRCGTADGDTHTAVV